MRPLLVVVVSLVLVSNCLLQVGCSNSGTPASVDDKKAQESLKAAMPPGAAEGGDMSKMYQGGGGGGNMHMDPSKMYNKGGSAYPGAPEGGRPPAGNPGQ